MKQSKLFLLSIAVTLVNCVELGPVGFNVYSDIYSKPQYGVSIRGGGGGGGSNSRINNDDYILKEDAIKILESSIELNDEPRSQLRDGLIIQDGSNGELKLDTEGVESHPRSPFEYRFISLNKSEYFCQIPRDVNNSNSSPVGSDVVPGSTKSLDPSDPIDDISSTSLISSSSSSSLPAKSKALELLQPLADTCLYYHAGYWTYSICYGQEITQFHASASAPRDRPPEPEKGIPSFILGRFDNGLETVETITSIKNNRESGVYYASQLLGNGTECDLVGEHRSIEVQYLCNPKMPVDSIVLIKEVRTCHYRMVINTKRLCNELTFVPPKEPGINEIKCRKVLTPEEAVLYDINELSSKARDEESSSIDSTSAEEIMKLSGGLVYENVDKLLDIGLYEVEETAPKVPIFMYSDSGIIIPSKLAVDITGTPIMEEYASTLEFIRDGLLEDIGRGFYTHKGVKVSGGDEFGAEDIHVLDIEGRLIAKASVSVSNGIGQVIITVDDEVDQSPKLISIDETAEQTTSEDSEPSEAVEHNDL